MRHNDRLKRRLEGLSTPPMSVHHGVSTPKIAVGDRVRVHETAEATAAGVAGLVGEVVDFAAPPVTDVAVIGAVGEDNAVNVSFAEKEDPFWFAMGQLEILGHAAGSQIKSAGQGVSGKSGGTAPDAAKPKPWWKFGRG